MKLEPDARLSACCISRSRAPRAHSATWPCPLLPAHWAGEPHLPSNQRLPRLATLRPPAAGRASCRVPASCTRVTSAHAAINHHQLPQPHCAALELILDCIPVGQVVQVNGSIAACRQVAAQNLRCEGCTGGALEPPGDVPHGAVLPGGRVKSQQEDTPGRRQARAGLLGRPRKSLRQAMPPPPLPLPIWQGPTSSPRPEAGQPCLLGLAAGRAEDLGEGHHPGALEGVVDESAGRLAGGATGASRRGGGPVGVPQAPRTGLADCLHDLDACGAGWHG